ncbi:hypothetical protein HDU90_009030 [Geranomyces variabilis]|nr:hypothetical protein HDU90_009030 [Geranomyces variabilis]
MTSRKRPASPAGDDDHDNAFNNPTAPSAQPRRRLRRCFFAGTAVGACTPTTTEFYRLAGPPAPGSSLDATFLDAVRSAGVLDKWEAAQQEQQRMGEEVELWACHAHFVWCMTAPAQRETVCRFLFPEWEEGGESMAVD